MERFKELVGEWEKRGGEASVEREIGMDEEKSEENPGGGKPVGMGADFTTMRG